jgi:gamma-glutamylputrescine oxidase
MADTAPNPNSRPCWYEVTCSEHAIETSPLCAAIDTEVCILGGGLAGLATALSLAERGINLVLLERQTIGAGASGRNGGMVSGGFAKSTLVLERRLGLKHAQALHGASMEAVQLIRQRVTRENISVVSTDGILIASLFNNPHGVRNEITALNRAYGMRLQSRSREWMRASYHTKRYTEGIFDPDGFHLDPLALVRGYSRAAVKRGARVHERSPAVTFERKGAAWLIRTKTGQIAAKHLVLATSAPGKELSLTLHRALVSVATFIIVTEPLGTRLKETILPPYAVYDDRFATGYYRPLPDGRLLWGGRIGLADKVPHLEQIMRRDLAYIYPQLSNIRIDSAWSGQMAFSRHKMPLIGKLAPGLWMAAGFGGHGLNTTTMAGELIAQAIAEGGQRHELFRPFKPVTTFGSLGRVAAQAIYHGYILRDLWRVSGMRKRNRVAA